MADTTDTTTTTANDQDQGGYDLAHRVTGIKVPTLQSMVHRRQVPHYRVGPRLVIFRRAELEAWLRQRKVTVRETGTCEGDSPAQGAR